MRYIYLFISIPSIEDMDEGIQKHVINNALEGANLR
jgi:hypothetical protein